MEIQEMFNVLLGEIKEIKLSVNNLEQKVDVLDERTLRLEKGQSEIRENILNVMEFPVKNITNLKDEVHAIKQIIGVHSVDIQLLKNKTMEI